MRPERLDSGRRGGCLPPRQRHALAAGLPITGSTSSGPRSPTGCVRSATARSSRSLRPRATERRRCSPSGRSATRARLRVGRRRPGAPHRRRRARGSCERPARARRRPDPQRHGDGRPRHGRLGCCRKTDRARLRRRSSPRRQDGSPPFTVDRGNPGGIAPGARRPRAPEARRPFDLALARHRAAARGRSRRPGTEQTRSGRGHQGRRRLDERRRPDDSDGGDRGMAGRDPRGRRGALEGRRRPSEPPRGS